MKPIGLWGFVLDAEQIQFLSLLISAGAVAFAVVAVFVLMRASFNARKDTLKWRGRANELNKRIANIETVVGSYPGLVLVWEEAKVDPGSDWGSPKVFGSTAALASLVRFAEPGRPKDFAKRVLDGLADHQTLDNQDSQKTLRQFITDLRSKGEAFSCSIVLPGEKLIEADGNVAGAQVVLWLEDASIRGRQEKEAISKFETEKLTALSDPEAFVDIMGRAPFPIWRMSGTGRIVWANDAYLQAVSSESLEVVLEQQIHLDDACLEQAKKALVQNKIIQDARPVILSGKRVSSLVSMYPISGGIAGIAVDASESEALRSALKSHIRAHDETLNNMAEAVVIFNSKQKISFHNRAFAQMFDLEDSWFSGERSHGEWLDHLREKRKLPEHPNYREWKQGELDLYLNWPDEMPDELWSLPDGRELRLVRMRDPEGGISLLFGDITDKMTMKSQMGTLINVQKATLDKLTEGVAVFGPDGRLQVYNSAFMQMWELPETALKDEPRFRDLISHMLTLYHDRDFWNEMKARTTDPSPEARRHVEGEIIRSDDTILTYLSKPLPDGATLIAWDDVTSARATEAALVERAEALEAADRLKSEFVGHVSYQLRTPLTTISGYAELLQSGAVGELTDKQAEYVFAVQAASEDLARTIDDILDFAAIEADTIDLELGDVDVYFVLEGALEYVATKAEDTRITLELKCEKDIGVIRADEKRIKQVIYNLLSNAMRFTKPGGTIELGAIAEDDGIRIWVKDDGVGIPSDRQPQVFESFKSSRGGAGLGLALVERFVDLHGGWTSLESDEGKGTLVVCHLPRYARTDAALPELDL
ncbi:MAG TPA: PAS domain-containing sensor histidine kinase [Hellea balneolensis]|uniref:histidine kinase n=1 Tax=Hellea balneolensis TaxID=287478 RepID=A0A7C5M4A7_9PROT|nr:PAS domain-containing sensor histidine kinase [Hellea balneolensis]